MSTARTNAERQRLKYERKRSRGECLWCSAPAEVPSPLCPECRLKNRKQNRKRTGSSPWRPGGRGRTPLEAGLAPSSVGRAGERE